MNHNKNLVKLNINPDNFNAKFFKIVSTILFALCLCLSVSAQNNADQYITERPPWAGVWYNTWNKVPDFSEFQGMVAGEAGRLKWKDLEPKKGKFDFSDLKNKLQRAKNNNYYFYIELWTGENSPAWIYSNGVPKVNGKYPFYLDEDYKKFVIAFYDTLAATVAGYDPELIKRFAFIQPGFGSTGDRQLYKETPTDLRYNISKGEYIDFMKEMTIAITSAFWRHPETSNFTFLWNIDDYEGSDPGEGQEELYGAWMKENYNCQLRKQQFTIAIGYMCPNEMDQDNEQRDNFFGNSGRWGGNPEFVRGEFNDGKWGRTPMAMINRPLHYYWTAISSVDKGLDGWEIQYAEINPDFKDAYLFSHRYAYYKKAATSPLAFIALRDVLDYSDTVRFSESTYGEASRSNQNRIDQILSEYSSYGAKNDDNNAVKTLNQNTYLLNCTGYNDCQWNVISRNYRRFITQIEPNETSSGYWRIGDGKSIYSRFARGFDVEKDKNTMYFDVDDKFSSTDSFKVKIIYYANDGGSWELKYRSKGDSLKTACSVNNEVGQGWLTKEVLIEDAHMDSGGPNGADLILQNTGGTNCRFHMIELEKKSEIDIPVEETSRSTWQNNTWQFPGDTLLAWQYDYIQNTAGETSFILDSAQTIGIYGCGDNHGINVRSYTDADQFEHAAQFKWDNDTRTFAKNGQWLEYSVGFENNEPYQLLIRARNNLDAHFKLTIFNSNRDTVFYKDVSLKNEFENLEGGNDQTDWFRSKFALINLWGGYTVRFDWYDQIGEPGIFGEFSFIKSELDITPPDWYFVTVGNIVSGTDVIVMTTEAAKVYLVPAGTTPDKDSIQAAALAETEVNAYSRGKLATSGLTPGNYVVYAIDNSDNISEASRLITLQYPVHSRIVPNESELYVEYNPASELITINSEIELRQVDTFNILGKKVASIKCNGKMFRLQAKILNKGIYIVQIHFEDGTWANKKFLL